jgi:hypothetical protein
VSDHSHEEKPATESAQAIPWEQLAKLSPDHQKALFEKLIAENKFYFELTKERQEPSDKLSGLNNNSSWDLSNTLFGDSPFTSAALPASELSRLLGLPDIEALKDQAERFAEWTKKLSQLMASQQTLSCFLTELNRSALKYFTERNSQPRSSKATYALWTECGERAFAELNQNKRYIEAQATFLNNLTEVASLKRSIMQALFKQSGLSSQQDLETIYQTLHQLKREFRKESRQQTIEIAKLKKELNKLQPKQPPPKSPQK